MHHFQICGSFCVINMLYYQYAIYLCILSAQVGCDESSATV